MSDNYAFKTGSGTTLTRKAKDTGSGVMANFNINMDSSGNETPAGDADARPVYVKSAAGEAQLGFASDPRFSISVTPTINTVQFTTGDAVGGKQTLTSAARVSGGLVVLESITIVDKGNQKAACDILFFDSDPSAATITNNSPFVFSTDISKFIGYVHIATTDWITIDSIGICQLGNIMKQFKASGSAHLYVAVVGTGTPTYLSAGDLIFKYGFRQS